MESGIDRVGHAHLCPECVGWMAIDYVMRQTCSIVCGGRCEKCNNHSDELTHWMYTMKGKVKQRKGLI